MWTKVFPKYLMGRVNDNLNYYRFNVDCKDKHDEQVLKYDCGVYFVFSSKTKTLSIKTKLHFNYKALITCEFQILGKLNGEWELLNSVTHNPKAISDECVVFSYDLFGYDYEEFQVCFPAQGRVEDYLWIETDNEPTFKTLPLTAILLGSSVAQDSNDTSHGNICCYAYRKLNINIATLGISWTSSLTCRELLDKLKNIDTKIIVMDLYHVDEESFKQFVKEFPNAYYPIINSICRQDVMYLCKKFPNVIDEIHIDGNCRYDQVHLNNCGSQKYLEELESRGILERN